MKFNNRPNIKHDLPNGKEVWESRSVAINGIVVATIKDKCDDVYILCSKRGYASADFQGHMNLIAGYIDWDETGTKAFVRECWEEVGLNIYNLYVNFTILKDDLHQPWYVETNPKQNRQNISLRYGLIFEIEKLEDLPKLSLENNEIKGECENPMWLPLSQLGTSGKWAFNHDQVIINYVGGAIRNEIIKLTKD